MVRAFIDRTAVWGATAAHELTVALDAAEVFEGTRRLRVLLPAATPFPVAPASTYVPVALRSEVASSGGRWGPSGDVGYGRPECA